MEKNKFYMDPRLTPLRIVRAARVQDPVDRFASALPDWQNSLAYVAR